MRRVNLICSAVVALSVIGLAAGGKGAGATTGGGAGGGGGGGGGGGARRDGGVENERNGWGEWADEWVGKGSRPNLAERPVQTWLHRFMLELGGRAVRADGSENEQRVSGMGLVEASRLAAGNETGAEAIEQGDDERDLIPMSIGDKIKIDDGNFAAKSNDYVEDNRDGAKAVAWTCLISLIIALAATGAFLYSEIRMVLTTRSMDEAVVEGRGVPKELTESMAEMESYRWYYIGGAALTIVICVAAALGMLCHFIAGMMVSLGYELQGCGILVTLAAIAGTAAWLLFLGGCCWVCTRPWTGSLFIIVAFLGNIAIETQQPASVVMWLVFATAFCYVWSVWGSQLAPDERPKRDEERERLLPNA